MDHLILPQHIYQKILDSISSAPCESGGILAIKGNTISDFYFDIHAGVANRFYVPSSSNITKQVNYWLQEGKLFAGFIHSHRASYTRLSAMDIVAAEKTMAANQMSFLYMVIVCDKELFFYKVCYEPGNVHSAVEPCTFQIK